MVGITLIFIALLATLNATTQSRIERNLKIQESKSILYAFGILPEGVDESLLPGTATTSDLPWDETRLLRTIQRELNPVSLPVTEEAEKWLKESMLTPGDSIAVYVRRTALDSVQSIGFYLRGKGLWGTIQAFMAVNTDFSRAIGIDFTEQVETPGLGARITEQEFKSYFRNLDIDLVSRSETNGLEMVRSKDIPNTAESTNELQAVTGATQTCNGVLNMLRSDLKFYYHVVRAHSDLFTPRN